MLEIVQIIKEILISIATLTTIIIAILGASRWFKELKGKTEFDTARNLLKAIYRIRNEVAYCRSPLVSSNEFPIDYDGTKNNSPKVEGDALAFIYNNRWKTVGKELDGLELHLIEAEALWGSTIAEKIDVFRKMLRQLQVSISSLVDNKYSSRLSDFSRLGIPLIL